MIKTFSILLITIVCHSTYADSPPEPMAEFSGEGLIRVPGDYISLGLSVHSECQPSPTDAQQVTDDIVKKIASYLESLKQAEDKHFKILVNGGFTSTFSRWHKDRELCRNTFQKETKVTLKMGMTKDFDRIFSDLQAYVLKQFEQGAAIGISEVPRAYVTIGVPNPMLTREHRMALTKEALNLALLDAKAKFKAATKSCQKQRWKIRDIHEQGGSLPQPRAYFHRVAKASIAGAQAAPTPVSFDLIEIAKNLSVTFLFDGSLCFEP